MKNLLFIFYFVALTYGWTVDYKYQCACEYYINMFDCALASQFGCQISNSKQCQNIYCSTLDIIDCSLYHNYCYRDFRDATLTCRTFSTCSQLLGSNNEDCMLLNKNCRKLKDKKGPYCDDIICQQFSPQNCPDNCYLNNYVCSDFANCLEQKEFTCNIPFQCYHDGMKCLWHKCSHYQNESECIYVITQERRIQPCFWDEKSNSCTEATDPEVFDYKTCAQHTFGTYHWSSEKYDSGSCIPCYEMLLSVFIAVFLFLV
ncbi:unnamed protein product [Paramecium octaurelia]|uniref:Uncharacterized protein n=1 Tax=Paramecium octaurelia TaxID=43137 RepID=A0A8S1SVE4_PAROT|nr:unnamed protein product [Paramecium octaurelia]